MSDHENDSHSANELQNNNDEIENGRGSSQNDRDQSHSASNRSNNSKTNKSSHSADDYEQSPKRRGANYDSSDSESDTEHFKRKTKPFKRARIESSSESEEDFDMFDPNEGSTGVDLPKHMSKFIEKHFTTFLNDEAMSKVLEDLDLPKVNALKVPKLDDGFVDLFDNDSKMLKNDKNMAKVQAALMRAMAPVITAWKEMDTSNRDDSYQSMSMPEMCRLFERMIIALGQVNVTINFHRRWPILASLMNNAKNAQKVLVKEEQNLGADNTELFGPNFDKTLCDMVKSKNDKKELKKALGQTFNRGMRRPFRGGPSARGQAAGGRSFSDRFSRDNQAQNNDNNSQRGRGRGGYSRPSYRARYSAVKVCFPNGVKFPVKTVTGSTHRNKQNRSKASPQRVVKSVQQGSDKTRSVSVRFEKSELREYPSPSRGKVETFHRKLGKNDKRQLCPGDSNRCSDRMDRRAPKGNGEKLSKIQCPRTGTDRHRNRENDRKESHRRSSPNTRTICGSSLSKGEKGRGDAPSVQSQRVEPICEIRTFQIGKSERVSRHDKTGGSHGKVGSKRRIFQCTHASENKKIPEVSLERKTLSVPGHGIRVGTSPPIVYKAIKAGDRFFEKDRNQGHDISRRSDSVESGSGRVETGSENHSLHSGKSGFPHKLGENCAKPESGDRVSGDDDRFHKNDHILAGNEDEKHRERMQNDAQKSGSKCEGVGEVSRQADVVDSGSTSSTATLSAPSDGECEGTHEQSKLRDNVSPGKGMSTRSDLVDTKSGSHEWEITDKSTERVSHNDGCVGRRLGSMDFRLENSGKLVRRRETMAHKCEGTPSSDSCGESLCQANDRYPFDHSYGQHYRGGPSEQESGDCVPEAGRNSYGNLGVLHAQEDSAFGNISPGQREYNGRCIITRTMDGFQQLEVSERCIPDDTATVGSIPDRSLCGSTEFPVTEVLQLETRSGSHWNGCVAGEVEGTEGLCVSTILPYRSNFEESSQRGSGNDADCSGLAIATMVPESVGNASGKSDTAPAVSGTVDGSTRAESSAVGDGIADYGGVESVRKRAEMRGFSEDAGALLANKWREGTQATTNTPGVSGVAGHVNGRCIRFRPLW